jgi:hypothetical protein
MLVLYEVLRNCGVAGWYRSFIAVFRKQDSSHVFHNYKYDLNVFSLINQLINNYLVHSVANTALYELL